MINWLEFNGHDSRDFDCYIRTKQTFSRAKRDLSFIPVPGKSGDVIIDNGRYKNIEIQYGLTLFAKQYVSQTDNENFFYAWEEICKWLTVDSNYYKLTDSYDPLYYRKACIIDGLELSQPHYSVGKFDIKFNCKPYRYRLDGDTSIKITEQNTVITNTETHESLPYMKIYGNDDIKIYINGRQYSFYNVSGYIEIDSEMMNVYKGTTNMNNNYGDANFPILSSGKSTFAWNNNCTKIELKPRWRTI